MVATAGVGKAINKVVEQALDKSEKKAPKADAEAQSAFEKAMHTEGSGQTAQTQVVDSTQNAQVRTESVRPKSPGDSVLQGLDKLRSNRATMASDVNKLNTENEMSPEEMLKVKMEVDKMSFQEQVVIKGTTSVENDVKQVLKQQ